MSRPRIRTIKPGTWADERIGHVTRDARLLFVGLISLADDEGRMRDLPAAILGHVFPYDADAPRHLGRWLRELTDTGLVRAYTVGEHRYLLLPGFERHQVINRPSPSELPPPPDGTSPTPLRDVSVNAPGALTPGKEGKGKEGNPPDPPASRGEGHTPAAAGPGTPPPAAAGSPRQRGTNPRAAGRAAAASSAAAALAPAGLPDRVRWQTLRGALRDAVSGHVWEIWLTRLELAGVDRDGALVLDLPAGDRRNPGTWKSRPPRTGILIERCGERTGVRARLADAREHEGLAGVSA